MKKVLSLVLGVFLFGCVTASVKAPPVVTAQEAPTPAPAILTVQDIQSIIAIGLRDIRAKGHTPIGVEWNARVIWIEGKDDKGEPGLGAYNLRPLITKYLEAKNESKTDPKNPPKP